MLKILIIDDSRTIRKIVTQALNKYGYNDTAEAGDGEEAYALIKSDAFDCIFLDINMPVLDGFALLERLKGESMLGELEVILMSTEAKNLTEGELKKRGIDNVIPKPFSLIEFERVAVSLLNIIEHKKELKSSGAIFDNFVIVTDDSYPMRRIVIKQLELFGSENIIQAENGEIALTHIRELSLLYKDKTPVAILFLDLNMPVLDGVGLIEELEKEALLERVKIVILSSDIDSAKSLVDGKNIIAALPKPFLPKDFGIVFTPVALEESNAKPMMCKLDITSLRHTKRELVKNITSHELGINSFFAKIYEPLREGLDEFLWDDAKEVRFSETLHDKLFDVVYYKFFKLDTMFTSRKLLKLYQGIWVYKNFKQILKTFREQNIEEFYRKSYLGALKGFDKEENKDSIESANLDDFKESFELYAKNAEEFIEYALNNLCYAFHMEFWKRARYSKPIRKYMIDTIGSLRFTALSYVSKINEPSLFKELLSASEKISILILGFDKTKSAELRDSIAPYFRHYDIIAMHHADIRHIPLFAPPNIIIYNYDTKRSSLDNIIKELCAKYSIDGSNLNFLIIYDDNIELADFSKKEGSSVFDLKLKNYVKLPKSSKDYKTIISKTRELIYG